MPPNSIIWGICAKLKDGISCPALLACTPYYGKTYVPLSNDDVPISDPAAGDLAEFQFGLSAPVPAAASARHLGRPLRPGLGNAGAGHCVVDPLAGRRGACGGVNRLDGAAEYQEGHEQREIGRASC